MFANVFPIILIIIFGVIGNIAHNSKGASGKQRARPPENMFPPPTQWQQPVTPQPQMRQPGQQPFSPQVQTRQPGQSPRHPNRLIELPQENKNAQQTEDRFRHMDFTSEPFNAYYQAQESGAELDPWSFPREKDPWEL